MIPLVTVEQTREFLNLDADLPDSKLQGVMLGASASILNYLRLDTETAYMNSDGARDTDTDTHGYFEVPPNVQTATLLLIQAIMDKAWTPEHGFLPFEVTSMIYMLRDPAMA